MTLYQTLLKYTNKNKWVKKSRRQEDLSQGFVSLPHLFHHSIEYPVSHQILFELSTLLCVIITLLTFLLISLYNGVVQGILFYCWIVQSKANRRWINYYHAFSPPIFIINKDCYVFLHKNQVRWGVQATYNILNDVCPKTVR